jgi:hypothetical protein
MRQQREMPAPVPSLGRRTLVTWKSGLLAVGFMIALLSGPVDARANAHRPVARAGYVPIVSTHSPQRDSPNITAPAGFTIYHLVASDEQAALVQSEIEDAADRARAESESASPAVTMVIDSPLEYAAFEADTKLCANQPGCPARGAIDLRGAGSRSATFRSTHDWCPCPCRTNCETAS